MQLSISFLASVLPSATYSHYDADGRRSEPLAASAITPITTISLRAQDVLPGSLFWGARRGDQLHRELIDALAGGARTIVLDHQDKDLVEKLGAHALTHCDLLFVENVAESLLVAAREWRQQFSIPIVGIAGSIGKTTTKELLRAMVDQAGAQIFIGHDNRGELEDLAVNMLQLTGEHTAGVFEIATTKVGNVTRVSELLKPTIGLITTLSHAHLAGLSDMPTVAREMRSLFADFSPSQVGIVCGDVPLLGDTSYPHPVVRFGLKGKNTVSFKRVRQALDERGEVITTAVLSLYNEEYTVTINGHHIGLLYGALGASALAYFLQLSNKTIINGIEAFTPLANRFEAQPMRSRNGLVVDDSVDGTPEAVRAALDAIHQMPHFKQKIAVIGEMDDLGEKELFWHRQVGRMLRKALSVKHLVLVGEKARAIAQTAPLTTKISFAQTPEEAHQHLSALLTDEPSLVLVKGNESLDLGRVVAKLI